MKTYYLKKQLDSEKTKLGNIDGVAYSGEAIPYFCGFENFIVDLDSMRFSKPKVPLLRDHMSELVVGYAVVELEDDQLNIKGIISKKTSHGKEIVDLSEDGFDWELSIGVYEGNIEEGFSGEVNGAEVEDAVVLRNGLLREVSVTALGADKNTNATIFKQDNKEILKMNEKDYAKLVAKLGLEKGAKLSEIIAKLELDEKEKEEAIEEKEAVIEKLEESIETLEKAVEDLEEEISEIKEEEETEERAEEIEAAVSEKGLSLSSKEIRKIASSKESTDLFLSTVKNIVVKKTKIDKNFSKKFNIEGAKDKNLTSATLREQADQLVKEGKFKNFMAALASLQGEE